MTNLTPFREQEQEGEKDIFNEMEELTLLQMSKRVEPFKRGQHAKSTGCVEARFIIDLEVPLDFQHGIFKYLGREYKALVRFSNAQGTVEHDGKPTARGIAVKLLDVEGQRAIPGDTDTSQDFLAVNHPVFPFSDPADYLSAIKRLGIPLIGHWLVVIGDPQAGGIIKDIRKKTTANPLETVYWSGSPYWLGSADGYDGNAVKYSLVPRVTDTPLPAKPVDLAGNYLRTQLTAHLGAREAVFDFKVQRQTDPESMKVEDTTALWDETVSVPELVAVLRIPKQDEQSVSAIEQRCEDLSFNPWHALAEHRPIGGMNRLRRKVYEAGFGRRSSR